MNEQRKAASALAPLKAWWATLSARDRRLALFGAALLLLLLLWLLAIQPAWRTLRTAPAELDALELQLQTMQRLAAEVGELRAAPPVTAEQAAAALRAATERLGAQGRLQLQGERAVLTLNGVGPGALRDWLTEARSGARARPVEANLTRGAVGFSGTLVLSLGDRFVKLRWALIGGFAGALLALLAFAPAAWLAGAVANASGQRLLLADARGSLWRGSAVMVLSAGEGGRDASALPGRLHWTLSPDGFGLALRAQQACCINGELVLRLVPGLGRLRLELKPGSASSLGQWPASWLAGLGTPWNTLQPAGLLQLRSPGLTVEQVQGRWVFDGRADIEMQSMASRVSTLPMLGSYRVTLQGGGARGASGGDATLQLATVDGPLQLSGSGQWAAGKFRFRGQASAAPGAEATLANLLNIIGRRQGAVSLIAIG